MKYQTEGALMLKAFADNDSTMCGTDSYSVSNNLKDCLRMQSSIRFDFLLWSPIETHLFQQYSVH